MEQFKADLHIHSLLSPCGSLEMSPRNIIQAALDAKLDIIAITDHNSTKQSKLIKEMAAREGLLVICGAEINSSEEVHCLVLFETDEQLQAFQDFIDMNLQPIPNNPDKFGEQVVVDEFEMIIEEEKYLLIFALNATLLEIEQKVHSMGGLVIPAHVDRTYNGLISQLGFFPENLTVDAIEVSKNANIKKLFAKEKLPQNISLVRNSDAHFPHQIGEGYTIYEMEQPTFQELKMAMKNENGRRTIDIDDLTIAKNTSKSKFKLLNRN